jgi:uncharacterized membrane protein
MERRTKRINRLPGYPNYASRSYFLLLGLSLLFDLLFTFPPILLHMGINADLLYEFFRPVCHQIDGRSFHLFGYKLAVCSRCASIYYGFTIGILTYPLMRRLTDTRVPSPLYFIIPLLALTMDFSLNYLTSLQNTFLSRSITGGFFGWSTAFLFVPIWISLALEIKTKGLLRNEK